MKSKTAINRKKNRRKKNKANTKAEALWREAVEQETLESLDPIKNAKDNNLFVVDTAGKPNKLIRNKTTWAERKLTSQRLGLVLPAHTGKTFQEKRKLNDAENKVIDAHVKRIKRDEKKGEGVKEEVKEEIKEEVKEEVKQEVKRETKKPAVTVQSTSVKLYDMWGSAPAAAVHPKQSYIQDVLHPHQREYVVKPLKLKQQALPIPHESESYNPDPEVHEVVKQRNNQISAELSEQAREGKRLQTRILSNKQYFPRVDINDKPKEEEGEEEEVEAIRANPKRHKTKKEKMRQTKAKIEKHNLEKEKITKRNQRDIYRIPEILAGIEEAEKKLQERQERKLANKVLQYNLVPHSSDGKKIKQRKILPIARGPARLRTLDAVVNPIKERLLSMQNRGMLPVKNPENRPAGRPTYKVIEPEDVRELDREDFEKYMLPVLKKQQMLEEKEKKAKKGRNDEEGEDSGGEEQD